MSPTIVGGEPARELPDVEAGLLPQRYGVPMQEVFLSRARPLLKPGMAILDVGSGRSPTIARDDRPQGCEYVGLDISAHELGEAAPGAYDYTLPHDVTKPVPSNRTYDLLLSWQVLEHVKPLDVALDNLRDVLRPGGTMLAQLSGSFAAFALLGRVVPYRASVWAMSRFLGHDAEEKFPTHYDRCHAGALERMLGSWASVELLPFYRGAAYFGSWRALQRTYLAYESFVARRDIRNLATHYLLVATR